MTKKKTSPIRKGASNIGDATSSPFLKIGAGESVDIVVITSMDEMISIDQCGTQTGDGGFISWMSIAITDEQCPAEQLGITPRFRGFLPILVKNGDLLEQKIWAFTITVARQLSETDDAIDGIRGNRLRVKRNGTGLETSYTIITTGKTQDVSDVDPIDIVEHLGPQNREDILKFLVERKVPKVFTIMTDDEKSKFSDGDSSSSEEDDGWDDL